MEEFDRKTLLKRSAGVAIGAGLAGLDRMGLLGGESIAAAAPSAAAVKSGGTMRYAVAAGDANATADPAQALFTLPLLIAANCYDTLVRADANYNLAPALATDWTSNARSDVWTFKLRSGVTFHSGRPLTSDDVAYTMKRILLPATASGGLGPIAPYLQASGISTPDASTIRFSLLKPNAFFPIVLSAVDFSIVPNDGTNLAKTENGTGAFKLQTFDPLNEVVLTRSAHYWKGGGRPYLDGVRIVVIAEDATRLEALTSGSQDFVDNVTGAATLLLNSSTTQPLFLKYGGWVSIAAFGNVAPFNNPLVIEAMKYAASRKEIMAIVAPGVDIISADVPLPPGDPFYPQGLTPRPYDPERARSLLKQAGYPSGLTITCYAYEGDKLDTAVSYKASAAAAGIKVNVVSWPHSTFFSEIFLKKPCIGISVARLHASTALARLFGSKGNLNFCKFQSPRFDALVTEATGAKDPQRQRTLFGDALEIINNSASAVIPGWEHQEYGVSKRLHGVLPTNGGQIYLDGAYFS